MSYRPTETVYPVPWRSRIPSVIYLVAALAAVLVVVIGENSAADSWLYRFVVVQDRGRLIGARAFAVALCVGALASLIQGGMRGIRVYGEGLETREVAYGFLPRVRRYRWPQVERIVVSPRTLWIELWDGQRALLPPVGARESLISTLERVAAARDIPVLGGRGLDDIPERTVSRQPVVVASVDRPEEASRGRASEKEGDGNEEDP